MLNKKYIQLKSGAKWYLNSAYHGDCLDFMRDLPDGCIDLVLTDPPYGIDQGGGKNKSRNKPFGSRKDSKNTKGTEIPATDYKDYGDKQPLSKEHFDEMIRVSKNQIIFGANHFISLIPYDSSSWIVWDKDNSGDFADCELAWTSHKSAVKMYKYRWNGMLQENMKDKEVRIHPNQKPVKMLKRIIYDYSEKGMIILDCCLGSFNVAIASQQTGRYWVGCEDDDHYFETGLDNYQTSCLQHMMEF